MKEMWKITVTGMVQGIGYRPYIAELANEYNIIGSVKNKAGIVIIVASAEKRQLDAFVEKVKLCKPFGARVDDVFVEVLEQPEAGDRWETDHFTIEESEEEEGWTKGRNSEIPQISIDLPTCPDCERELFEKSNYRYRYPFISCVSCGPRYSIIKKVPYDRCNTAMSGFALCSRCNREYMQEGNRRRHAQTIGCRACGPTLRYKSFVLQEHLQADSFLCHEEAVGLLKNGGVLALKDIGGFHLAADAFSDSAAESVRLLKGREKKPFAVMFESIEQIREFCEVSEQEEELLCSLARPIVLLKTKTKGAARLAPGVNAGSPDTGAMLPSNPLQIMLVRECGPLIMTSANRSGEPIITENRILEEWFEAAVRTGSSTQDNLGILEHDRDILTPLDDSIVRIIRGRRQILRRSRGFVPEPIDLHVKKNRQIFAAGADMKACFGFAAGDKAYLSQYLGDMQDERIYRVYEEQLEHMQKLFGFVPEAFTADGHPAYLSTRRLADKLPQHFWHHHAHIASVLAEHGIHSPTLGVALDGTGYGRDATVWGSEFMLCQDKQMQRVGHLKPVRLIGGDQGSRNADMSLYGYLSNAFSYEKAGKILAELGIMNSSQVQVMQGALKNSINTITSSSMGRLFDAVSAMLGICHYNSYEGEAPIELEYSAAHATEAYPMRIPVQEQDGTYQGNTEELFAAILQGIRARVKTESLALGFIKAVVNFVIEVCDSVYFHNRGYENQPESGNFRQIALSGGTCQNRLLLEIVIDGLEEKGYKVYINEQVPPSDSGIALGQLYLAE